MTVPAGGVVMDDVAASGARVAGEALGRLAGAGAVAVEPLPAVSPSVLADLGAAPLFAVCFEISGAIPGALALVIGERAALRLTARLVGAGDGALSARHLDALQEVGNIGASSYLNSVARQFSRSCLPSVPMLVTGDALEVWSSATRGRGEVRAARVRIGNDDVEFMMVLAT